MSRDPQPNRGVLQDAWCRLPVNFSEDELRIGAFQVMQSWERPLMEVLAQAVTRSYGDVLEVGFGMGISASAILRFGCQSYTVVEAHPDVASKARAWAAKQNTPVRIIEAFWEDVVESLGPNYDGVLFDTYPLSDEEKSKNHFAFIPVAPALLRPGGVLTYYSDSTARIDTTVHYIRVAEAEANAALSQIRDPSINVVIVTGARRVRTAPVGAS